MDIFSVRLYMQFVFYVFFYICVCIDHAIRVFWLFCFLVILVFFSTYFAIKLFLVLFIILFFSIFCLVSGKTQGNEGGREKDQKSIKLYISCMLSSLRTLLCFKLYEVIKKNNKLQSFFFSLLRIHSSQDCNVVISISLMQFRNFLTKRMMNDNDDKR